MHVSLRRRRASLLVSVLLVSAWVASPPKLHAQPPSIEPLGWLDQGVRQSVAKGVSPDGSTVVGYSRSATGYDRAFLWTEAEEMQELGTLGNTSGNSYAEAVTVAGNVVVVGHSASPYGFYQAFRWEPASGMETLRGYSHPVADSRAFDISPDGVYTVGSSAYGSSPVFASPTRWNGLTASPALGDGVIGTAKAVKNGGSSVGHTFSTANGGTEAYWSGNALLSPPGWESFAEAIRAEGSTVVGYGVRNGKYVAMTNWGGVNFAPLHDDSVNSYAYDVDDLYGMLVVGEVASGSATRGDACIWHPFPRLLRDLLIDEYGVDLTGWGRLYAANSCSGDGRVIVGSGEYDGATTAFRVYLPLDQSRPTVESAIEPGETYDVPLGGAPFSATFTGQDEDGDELTLSATGLPPSAQLVPTAGSTGAPPFAATLELTPTLADVGEREVTIAFADEAYAGNPGSIRFTLNVPPNNLPAAASPEPVTVECNGELNLVKLSTTVSDADDHPLTVVWKVDGVAKQTTLNVLSGTTIHFEHSYGDGDTTVMVEVSDGFQTATASTTVTVEDTTAPAVFVAQDVQVATDPGKDFATGVALTSPTVTDACDGDPELTNNAPAKFPLGVTTVVWTATDADGNVSTGTQRVTVVDREKPVFGDLPPLRTFVDAKKLFSTAPLVPPAVKDNVPDGLQTSHDAPARLPIGTTVVRWTATDAAGNQVTAEQNVTVVNRKPKAKAGKAIRLTTKSDRGAKATLDGGASSDRDQHKLKFSWSAPGVKLNRARTAKPVGVFPVGTTTATLTVTDPAGASATAKVKVIVKLQNSKRRARGKQANDAFEQVFHHGTRSAVGSVPTSNGLAGYAYANAARRTGYYLGEHVQWNDGESPEAAALEYSRLRSLQSLCGQRAADAYLHAYAETGEEDALHAAFWALNGVAYAGADLLEP